MLKYSSFCFFLLIFFHSFSQDTANNIVDTIPTAARDTADTINYRIYGAGVDSTRNYINTFRDSALKLRPLPARIDSFIWNTHPVYRFDQPSRYTVTIKKWEGREGIFYSIIGLLLFFAIIKNGFPRYVQDLFQIFFRTTSKQRQVKEQLVQSPLPSLLLNLFFLLSVGMFSALALQYYRLAGDVSFWLLLVWAIAGLALIYALKFLSLKLLGWIFQMNTAADSYIFIVFTTNKVMGMTLIPFLVILAFSYGLINQTAMTLGIVLVIVLFAYRYFLSFVTLRRQISIGIFHFFLYLFALEIAPLLLINKLLFRFLGETS